MLFLRVACITIVIAEKSMKKQSQKILFACR